MANTVRCLVMCAHSSLCAVPDERQLQHWQWQFNSRQKRSCACSSQTCASRSQRSEEAPSQWHRLRHRRRYEGSGCRTSCRYVLHHEFSRFSSDNVSQIVLDQRSTLLTAILRKVQLSLERRLVKASFLSVDPPRP